MPSRDPKPHTLEPVALAGGLDHSAIIDSAGQLGELEAAAARLRRDGLVAHVTNSSPARVVGGRRRVERGAIVTYDDAFALWMDTNGAYHAGLARNGNLGVQSGPGTLNDAIAFLHQAYSATER